MTPIDDGLRATPMSSRLLQLDPLRVDHAEVMAAVLGDTELYAFTGGSPPTVAELQHQYARQVVGRSDDGSEWWLNWIVHRRADAEAVGFVQATVTREATGLCAEVAWVIGVPGQHRGYGREAARLMVDWLRRHGISTVVAHVHPDHHASAAVARRIGLVPTDRIEDGEVRWQDR